MIHHKNSPILYVDDTVEQRYAMRRILESEGFRVLEAGSGKEAMELLKEETTLAVVDVKLPDIDGYELSRRMKATSPNLQVLQVSASFHDPNSRVEGFSGGADAYLAQPVHPSELVSLIRRMQRTAEAEETLRFLAGIGPKLSESLTMSDTADNIFAAILPRFANRCGFALQEFRGSPACFFSSAPPDQELCASIQSQSNMNTAQLVNSRFVIAPLYAGSISVGTIGFQLDQDREYTPADLTLAQDLANRAALALHNCILFCSEQMTRSALVQSEKLATAGRMTGAIAHEINNPLEALTNLLYIIQCSAEATESIRELASTALAEVTRIAHITRQTLTFYRDLQAPTKLNLAQSVSDTLHLYSGRFAQKKIAVELMLDEGVHIKGIKGELRQVISNLLINALEAMEAEGKLNIAVIAEGDQAVLCIADSGPGIRQEILDRIFEPFFTTKQGTGTGLGLWITQTIVEKHDGTIRVSARYDAPDHGTRFELRFPRV